VRLVLDTNTVISGLLWHGTPGKLIDAAHAKTITLCTSAELLAELRGVLLREKFAKQLATRGLSAIDIFDGYAGLCTIVVPAIMSATIVNDPADDAVLACALGAKADLIVSGDRHLLDLKAYQDTRIVSAADAIKILPI
jgi:putative PIN family toxin of toxin-antitoxin system